MYRNVLYAFLMIIINRKILFSFILSLCIINLHALDVEVTQKEVGGDFRLEHNRSLDYSGDVSVFGDIELNGQFGARGGLALGWLDDEFDVKTFASVRYTPFIAVPIKINLAYNYYGLPGPSYNSHTHTLFPYFSFNGKWGGLAVGVSFRFSSFFGEPPIFDTTLSFSGNVNFINDEKFLLGLTIANFNDFYIKNLGAYSIRLNFIIHIDEHWSFSNELEFMQSGSAGLSALFYGFAYRGGVRFSW